MSVVLPSSQVTLILLLHYLVKSRSRSLAVYSNVRNFQKNRKLFTSDEDMKMLRKFVRLFVKKAHGADLGLIPP